jgi:hypothetical protein
VEDKDTSDMSKNSAEQVVQADIVLPQYTMTSSEKQGVLLTSRGKREGWDHI